MKSKPELQTILKDRHGINKNITQPLSREECEQLLSLLSNTPTASKLVASFVQKNDELAKRNRTLGLRRDNAEKKLDKIIHEYQKEEEPGEIQEVPELKHKVESLIQKNQGLESQVKKLSASNRELISANEQLQKDNKDLKNYIDKIRLQLALEFDELLRYENSELRKGIVRILKLMLG